MIALALGLRYFAGVFAAGFVLGTLRTLWLAPLLGEVAAVTLELPIMLAFSWWWCRRLLAGRSMTSVSRAMMGGSAFVLLMLAELSLSLAFGGTVAQYLMGLLVPAGLLGLAGQLVFAVLPLIIKANCR